MKPNNKIKMIFDVCDCGIQNIDKNIKMLKTICSHFLISNKSNFNKK